MRQYKGRRHTTTAPVRVSSLRYQLEMRAAVMQVGRRFRARYGRARKAARAEARGILKGMRTRARRKAREIFLRKREADLVPIIMAKLGLDETRAREFAQQSLSTIAIMLGRARIHLFRRHGSEKSMTWRKYTETGKFVGYVSAANMRRSLSASAVWQARRLLAVRYGLTMQEVMKEYRWEDGQIKHRSGRGS